MSHQEKVAAGTKGEVENPDGASSRAQELLAKAACLAFEEAATLVEAAFVSDDSGRRPSADEAARGRHVAGLMRQSAKKTAEFLDVQSGDGGTLGQGHAVSRKPAFWLLEYELGDNAVPTHWIAGSEDAVQEHIRLLCRHGKVANPRVTGLLRSSVTKPVDLPAPESRP